VFIAKGAEDEYEPAVRLILAANVENAGVTDGCFEIFSLFKSV
jgi:hypothetical protein